MLPGLRGTLAAVFVPLAVLAGCGGGGATTFPGGATPPAGGGGELSYAIGDVPGTLDPLAARTIAAQTVSSQVFEPLVETLQGPYGKARDSSGLALGFEHAGDRRVWSVRLRASVRFQDGAPLNAGAVLVNAERWRTSALGRPLLPGLLATAAPRPDLVRFIFRDPVPNLPALLTNPRLGLVSPMALRPGSGKRATITGTEGAGSGPFALRRRSPAEIGLVRNRHWWGSRRGLGPALDRIRFTIAPRERRRFELLRAGDVRVAAELSGGDARQLEGDPLLAVVGAFSGQAVGFERSVRGIDSWRPGPLSGVWLALVSQP